MYASCLSMNVMCIERSVEWFLHKYGWVWVAANCKAYTLSGQRSMLLLLDKMFHDFIFKFIYKFPDMAIRYGDLSDMDY